MKNPPDTNLSEWTADVLECVNMIAQNEFTLLDIYYFEGILSQKHPDDLHLHAKIRQQLQLLRDKGYIEFLGNGKYKKRY